MRGNRGSESSGNQCKRVSGSESKEIAGGSSGGPVMGKDRTKFRVVNVVGVPAARCIDRTGIIVIEGDEDAQFRIIVPKLVRYTSDELNMIFHEIVSLADAKMIANVGAIIFVFQNDIDYAGNSVGTIKRTRAILQDFDSIDCRKGDRVQIDKRFEAVLRERK